MTIQEAITKAIQYKDSMMLITEANEIYTLLGLQTIPTPSVEEGNTISGQIVYNKVLEYRISTLEGYHT